MACAMSSIYHFLPGVVENAFGVGRKNMNSLRSYFGMQARLVRRGLRRAAQALRYRRISLEGVPVLFANSFPKSGTHLLTQVLSGFTHIGPAVNSGLPAVVTYEGSSGRERSPAEILDDLGRLQPGDIAYGHLHAQPETAQFLAQLGFAAYFILRDPRDVVVSHVHYVTEMEPGHILHTYYAQELHSFEERLRTSILGLPQSNFSFPDIRQRFEPFLGWLEQPEILTLQYEELILERGRGLERILEHAVQRGFPLSTSRQDALQILNTSINPQRSPTFRSGKVGGWDKHFSPENRRLFKEVSGDLLVHLGYERDHDW
jgi:hypothetical protein